MNIEDLQHIFKTQTEQITTLEQPVPLYFMLQEGDHALVQRHNHTELAALLPMLDSFQYAGSEGGIPRFVK
jgi:predicted esterase YcpF (UPF0227 family)